MCLDLYGPIRNCWDVFRYVRMHLELTNSFVGNSETSTKSFAQQENITWKERILFACNQKGCFDVWK